MGGCWGYFEGYQSIEVSSLTPYIGAEVNGVDLRHPLGNEQFSDRDQHQSFARKFRSPNVHPIQHSYGERVSILGKQRPQA